MSEFSGRCDLWDTFYIWELVDKWANVKVCQNDNVISINSMKDLIKYAPFLIHTASMVDNKWLINISDKSCIDIDEKDNIDWRVKIAQKTYRSCKRKGEEFIPKEVAKRIFWRNSEFEVEICRRVKEHPHSPKIDDIHTDYHNCYRKRWYEAMIRYGYDTEFAKRWTYGSY